MTDAADKVMTILGAHPAPEGGWDMPELRRASGLSIGAFAAALAGLRAAGKVCAFTLELAPVGPVAAEPAIIETPTVAAQVAAEARESVERRTAARTYSHSGYVGPAPSIGAQLQEKALEGAPQLAAGILRDRWGPTWDRLCRHARATGQKPVAAMIALLDSALDGEARA